jgi:hypothetical protein
MVAAMPRMDPLIMPHVVEVVEQEVLDKMDTITRSMEEEQEVRVLQRFQHGQLLLLQESMVFMLAVVEVVDIMEIRVLDIMVAVEHLILVLVQLVLQTLAGEAAVV